MLFEIPNMTCGGCARGVTAIIHDLDEHATVNVHLDTKTVEVTSHLTAETLQNALSEDGFPAQIK
ncbi:heavy-metal-associated domain-containing protein [Acinetobacter apis]|uniref:Copper chaperone n=1 Tax=Acinetobacter apis TaxID=1229165 RepID=A0A217EDE0_9GAMM|nr:heavy-metal-associated domain-containing protein [Acinetobacter apis]SNQ28292.1 copper chaperone [Acinetobacter apis]